MTKAPVPFSTGASCLRTASPSGRRDPASIPEVLVPALTLSAYLLPAAIDADPAAGTPAIPGSAKVPHNLRNVDPS
jgi:hypothetical protein